MFDKIFSKFKNMDECINFNQISKNPFLFKKQDWFYYINDLLEIIKLDNKQVWVYDKFINRYWNNEIFEKNHLIKSNYLNKSFFLFPYSIWYGYPMFNLAKLVQISKTWNTKLVNLVVDLVIKKIEKFIKNYDAIIVTPHSVDRKNSPLIEIEKRLFYKSKIIKVDKIWVSAEIKNVKNIDDKIKIANSKFNIKNIDNGIKKILIIDDMINTWATVEAIWKKIKEIDNNIKVDCLSIIWSLDKEIISNI